MQKHKTRLMAVSGATLALIVASTAAVAAHPGDRDQDRRPFGKGHPGIGAGQRLKDMPGMRAGMRAGLRGALDDLERREVTLQTADGVTAQRLEQGVVESATDDSLTFTLGSGEAVTIVIDDDTEVVAFEEQTIERGRWSRERMVPTEVELEALVAGAEIVAWSDSEDGGDFVASRIVLQPAGDADEAAEAEAAEAEAAEAAAATDA